MLVGSNRPLSSWSPCKRQEAFESKDNPSAAAMLMAMESPLPFHGRVPGLPPTKENGVDDEAFRAVISTAKGELASLLQDLCRESSGTPLWDAMNPQARELLMRAVRCAAKQYMLRAEWSNLALTDELTGLYNRRGFLALAERQLKLGRRSGREMTLFAVDVDCLKQINDVFGHSEGDRVLKRTAEALEQTFRDSDVVARLGGDEFAVLAIEADGHGEAAIKARLFECLKSVNTEQYRYQISVSLGLARFEPRSCTSLGDLMIKADQAMYEQKRRRTKPLAEVAASFH